MSDDRSEQFSVGEGTPQAVSANILARYLGIPPKDVYDLAKVGVLKRLPGRLFELEESVRRYCDHLRRQVANLRP